MRLCEIIIDVSSNQFQMLHESRPGQSIPAVSFSYSSQRSNKFVIRYGVSAIPFMLEVL